MMKYSWALLAAAAAVEASPFPQAVTAAISPKLAAPSGCATSYPSSFGIVNINVTQATGSSCNTVSGAVSQTADGQPQGTATVSGVVSQISDAQPQGGAPMTVAHVSQITDGQVQGGVHTAMMMPVSQISDGQIQGAPKVTMMPVSVISDGQPQAPQMTAAPISQISDGQPQAASVTAAPVSQISDGQPQAASVTAAPVSQISDGQPQGNTATAAPVSQISDGQPQANSAKPAVSQISDGQPQANTVSAVSQISDAQPQATGAPGSSGSCGPSTEFAFCEADDSLVLTLENGILKDNKGRTGYIASNYQFQFDSPPQAGAIYTAGFSVCGNGTLTLGGSSIFWQCRSGSFYNIYDRNWAPQCNEVYVQTGNFVKC